MACTAPARYPGDIAAFTCGALLPVAFAPHEWWPAAIILCAPLPLLWSGCSARRAVLRGWLFGMALFSTGLYWVHISIQIYGGLSALAAWSLLLLLSALLALCPALSALLYHRATTAWQHPLVWWLAFPVAWTLGEWVRSWLLGGFPWLSLGYSQLGTPLGSYAPVFGIHGVGWLTAASAAALGSLYLHRRAMQWGWWAVGLMALLWLPGLYRHEWTTRQPELLNVALVQGGLPQQQSWDNLEDRIRRYTRLSAPHRDRELLVWPEAVLPAYRNELQPLLSLLSQQTHGDLLLGVLDTTAERTYNSLIKAGSAQGSAYYKRHLVPFGEYTPPGLQSIMVWLGITLTDITPGNSDSALLPLAGGPAAASICYDILFGASFAATARHSTLLINVSNDGWFGDSWGPHQHLQIARARALENGRYLLRATNNGISAIINQQGRILQRSAQFTPQVLTATIPRYQGNTPYAYWGDFPVITLSALLLAGMRYRRPGVQRR